MKLITSIVFILTLSSCIEGRSGKSLNGISNNGLSPETTIGTALEIVELEYIKENFSQTLDALSSLFDIPFSLPSDITEQAQCPSSILAPDVELYRSYLLELNKVAGKYQRSITRVNEKILAETNENNRKIYQEAQQLLLDERELVMVNTFQCERVLNEYDENNGSAND